MLCDGGPGSPDRRSRRSRTRCGGGGASGSSTGEMTSVRSAIAVACCSRFSSVGALRMPPPSCTARAAAAEIWNGIRRSTARGSTGCPAASSSARSNPLRTPDSGSGHLSTSSAYSAAPMPRMSSSGVASGKVAGNANATSPSTLTRTRLGWSIDSATPARCAASAAAASDWIARAPPIGDGAVSATSARDAPRIHSATTRPPDPVLATSRTRATPGMSMRLSLSVRDRISCSSSSDSVASGSTKVRATCRSRAVSSACQNCRVGGPPWKTSSR